jgi:hypothetical protein
MCALQYLHDTPPPPSLRLQRRAWVKWLRELTLVNFQRAQLVRRSLESWREAGVLRSRVLSVWTSMLGRRRRALVGEALRAWAVWADVCKRRWVLLPPCWLYAR